MAKVGGQRCAPAWATVGCPATKSLEQVRWEKKFRARWDCMTSDQRQRRHQTTNLVQAESRRWGRMQELVQIRFGRRELRTGRIRFTAAELINALEIRSDEKAIIE